eukprot:3751967-Pleurochrysis_carterae.AAC.1
MFLGNASYCVGEQMMQTVTVPAGGMRKKNGEDMDCIQRNTHHEHCLIHLPDVVQVAERRELNIDVGQLLTCLLSVREPPSHDSQRLVRF